MSSPVALLENADSVTMESGAAFEQYAALQVNASGQAIAGATESAPIAGVALEAATAAGESRPVMAKRGAKVTLRAGAAIAAGASVMADNVGTAGRVITRTGTNPIFAIALTAAAADGDYFQALVV